MQVTYSQSAMSVTAGLLFFFLLLTGVIFIVTKENWDTDSKILYASFFLVVYFFSTTVYALRRQSQITNKEKRHFSEKQVLFSELYQNSPVPYIRTDRSGGILHANAAALRMFSKTEAELEGEDLLERLLGTSETAHDVARIKELVLGGTSVNDREAILKRFDGSERWVMVSAFPYANRSEILVTLVDITKQKNVEAAKTEFVSLASHQLRTPIAAILWNLELLGSSKMGELSDKQKEFIVKLKRSADRMSVLIKDFLDASQLEMGTFAASVSEISLTTFINEQIEEFESLVEQKKLTIDKRFPEAEVVMQNDEHLLRMIVTNLLSNAVKYTMDSGTIVVGYVATDQAVAVTIRDTGMGIPAKEQGNLFSKFYRATNVRSSVSGTGIGLYIVKQAVKMMGGKITFTSKEGEGTEFVVTLPIRR